VKFIAGLFCQKQKKNKIKIRTLCQQIPLKFKEEYNKAIRFERS
jgi:hypothetical protein